MSRIWVELDISPYENYQIIAYRLDNGVIGTLRDSALRRAENMIDLYNYGGTNYSGIYQESEIDEKDFVPIDTTLQIEN